MPRICTPILAFVLFVTITGIAAANPTSGDPRVCVLNNRTACAREAATVTVRIYMSNRTGNPWKPGTDPVWDADITCHHNAGTLLRWYCSWSHGAQKARVTFLAAGSGWHRRVWAVKL